MLSNSTQSNNIYCSHACWANDGTDRRIQSWLSGEWNGSRENGEISNTVRKYLLKEADYKCSECSWDKINPVTGNCPLDVDHIDGDSENNSSSNLKVLCPNCHSLTPTYKALNITGRGARAYRKKYNQFDLVTTGNFSGRREKDLTKVTCICGETKSRESEKCRKCRNKDIERQLIYPPNEIMVAEIKRIGLEKYAPTLGRTSNALKKYLKKQGYTNDDLRIEREAKVVFCSSCQIQLTEEEVAKNWVRCTEHHVKTYMYPPLEDIIAGVEAMGHNKYAASIGIKYGSTVRKYLARYNVVIK